MLDDNSKIILSSCVSEHAYKPSMSPLSLCVLSEGVKGSFLRDIKTFLSCGSRSGFLFISFEDVFINSFLGKSLNKSLLKFSYGFHNLIYRLKFHIRLFLGFAHSFDKGFMLFFLFDKITDKIHNFLLPVFREFEKHRIYFIYFRCFHNKMINKGELYVNDYHFIAIYFLGNGRVEKKIKGSSLPTHLNNDRNLIESKKGGIRKWQQKAICRNW